VGGGQPVDARPHLNFYLVPGPDGSGHRWVIDGSRMTCADSSFANGVGTGFLTE
jgi:hypothetical protein